MCFRYTFDGMKVLGIETSCDETAAAVVTADRRILSNLVLSQQEHLQFGGVVPEVAARAHLSHIDTLVEQALRESATTWRDLSAIAVTAGPGLIGGVLVGVMTAKAIAAVHNIPLVGVNHLEGHALTARLTDDVAFPYLLLLVSGGHCQLLVVEDVGRYRRLGTTIDDAVGECFDKTAKILGLGYPGGPAVERTASLCGDAAQAKQRFALPRPLLGRPGCDFSFSGLKTAVKRAADGIAPAEIPALCAAFQETVADILCDRVEHALQDYLALNPAAPTLVVGGGVAANAFLRGRLERLVFRHGVRFAAPPRQLCTDNAAMIAWAGIERFQKGMTDDPSFPVHARWALDPAAATVSPKSQKV